MTRVLLLVEGQTEEAFVNRSLVPHLLTHGVFVERASILRTKEPPAGSPYKGGAVQFQRMRNDARRLLNDSDAIVTTLIDYYGLPEDFPERSSAASLADPRHRAERLEGAFAAAIGHPRFRPFLALHEFEAWIFAVPDVAAEHLSQPFLSRLLARSASDAGGPELVNDNRETAPSRRLQGMLQQVGQAYRKTLDGPDIVEKAGLEPIRRQCPHFAAWLAWLESLGRSP